MDNATTLLGLDSRVSNLTTNLDSLSGILGLVQSTVSGVQSNVTSLTGTVAGLGTTVTGVQSSVTSLTGSVTGLGTTVAGVQTNVTNINTRLGVVETTLNTLVGGLCNSVVTKAILIPLGICPTRRRLLLAARRLL